MRFDALDRLASETDPFGAARTFQYDAAGNLTRRVDRLGRRINWTYDKLDRVTTESWFDTTTSTNRLRELTSVYNNAGNVARIEQRLGTGTNRTQFSFTYDNLDRVTTVTDTADYAAGVTVTAGEAPITPRSVKLSQTYVTNGDLRATSASINGSGSPAAGSDYRNDYTYDNLGRMTQIVQTGTAVTGQPAIRRKRVDLHYTAGGRLGAIVRSQAAQGPLPRR